MTLRHNSDAFRIVCVCTGNVFRSRAAEHFLRVGLSDRLGAGAADFEVSSAGVGVQDGRPLQPGEAAALLRVGLPPDDRASHRLHAGEVVRADLVLCADRSHRSAVLELDPGAMRRTFLLQELARLAGSVPSAEALGAVAPAARAQHVVRSAAAYRATVPPETDDEIGDPWGRADDVLSSAVDLVRHAVARLLDALVGVGGGDDARHDGRTRGGERGG